MLRVICSRKWQRRPRQSVVKLEFFVNILFFLTAVHAKLVIDFERTKQSKRIKVRYFLISLICPQCHNENPHSQPEPEPEPEPELEPEPALRSLRIPVASI